MTDTTTETVRRLAHRLKQQAEPVGSMRVEDALDRSARDAAATLRALAAERDALRALLLCDLKALLAQKVTQ